jgi:GNAT superfamily N-acetyltransferase
MDSQKISLDRLTIINTQPRYAEGICRTVRRAFHVDLDEECEDCMKPRDIQQQIERFAEGQFVAIYEEDDGTEIVVGMASTMRTSRPPSDKALSWMDQIGGLGIPSHEPDSEWLYGVEMAVRPMYHRNGIGTRLYKARFQLVKELNLHGWYAVGMLMGYENYADKMDVETYGNKVIAGEIIDPTVTMQMNRGFRAEYVVTYYLDEPPAGDAGVLIVWDNPDYKEN